MTLCSKEKAKRLQLREKNKQKERKIERRTQTLTKIYNAYRTNPLLKLEIKKQTYLFACLSAKLWMAGLTPTQIGHIYECSTHKIARLIFSNFPKLADPEIKKEQLLRTKQNWFECYELLTDYGVSYDELKIFLDTQTDLLISQTIIKKEILAIKKLLEQGAVWNSKSEYYTFQEIKD